MENFVSAAPGPDPISTPAALYAGVDAGHEDAIARFDQAMARFAPDESLLSGSPTRSLTAAMAKVVEALTRLDPQRLERKQGWWHRFTGADLVARIELEVGVRTISADMRELAQAVTVAGRALATLGDDIVRLDETQDGHVELIALTRALLEGSDAAHPVTARLHRRLGNLEALHASNRLARAQMALAIDHLSGLIDRYRDIEQLLYPVWQHYALALAQGAAATPGGDLARLGTAQGKLLDALDPSGNARL
jgi:hypothetical protein